MLAASAKSRVNTWTAVSTNATSILSQSTNRSQANAASASPRLMAQITAATFNTKSPLVIQSPSLGARPLGCKSKSSSLTAAGMMSLSSADISQHSPCTRIYSASTLCSSKPKSLPRDSPLFAKAGSTDSLIHHQLPSPFHTSNLSCAHPCKRRQRTVQLIH